MGHPMSTQKDRRNHRRRGCGALVGIALGAVLGAPAAGATQTAAAPRLSIAVDNGRTTAAVGDTLTYTVTVRNLDATGITGLRVTQTVPAGISFGSADGAGELTGDTVHWLVDVAAGGGATVHSMMTVTSAPAGALRLASVACALVRGNDAPVVCASHFDTLPAGTAADAAAAAAAKPAPPSSSARGWWLAAGLGAGLVAVGGAGVWARRRHVARSGPTGT